MDDSVERMLRHDDQDPLNGEDPATMEIILDIMMLRRKVLIEELRGLDRVLVQHGRLQEATLDRRVR